MDVVQTILLNMIYLKITIEQYCPFCGEEHEEIEEHIIDYDK